MKICVITSGHSVYDSRIYYKEIMTLKEKYDEIYMVAPGEKDFITEEGIIVKAFRGRTSQFDRFRVMKEMYKLALEIKADVYHAHEPDSFNVAVKLKKALGAKIVYDSHEYHPEGFSEHFKYGRKHVTKLVYVYEKHLAKKADYIVTVNDILVKKFKEYNDNVVLLPNYPVMKQEKIQKDYENKPTFVYVGGMTKDRGILKILQAIELVHKNYKYIFIGGFTEGSFEDQVQEYAFKNLNDKDIFFTGQIPHTKVFDYLKQAYAGFVLLQPNNWRYVNAEPIKLFEYMMSKTAVIGGDYPMIRNIVDKANCGVLARADSPQDIARAIEKIGENIELVKSMGEKGYDNAKKHYNWDIIKDRLINMYAEIENLIRIKKVQNG